MKLINGTLFCGHYIFVKDFGRILYSDALRMFQLEHYTEAKTPEKFGSYTIFSRIDDWLCIADDYTIYNSSRVKLITEKLSESYEILRVACGDVDNSIEYYHYDTGKVLREFIFEDYYGRDSKITKNIGTKFQAERGIKFGEDPCQLMTNIALEVGIDLDHFEKEMRSFSANKSTKKLLSRLAEWFQNKQP